MPPSTRRTDRTATAVGAPVPKTSSATASTSKATKNKTLSTERKRRAPSPASRGGTTEKRRTKRPRRKSSIASTNINGSNTAPPIIKESFLEKLPEEILLLILSHLPGPQYARRRSFYSISLTSKRLNRAANDFLYEWFDSRTDHGSKFLKTLVANPDLASRVRNITWSLERQDQISREENSANKPSSGDCRMLRESLKAIGAPNRASWVKDYSEGWSADMLRLAAIHSPNLRELNILDETSNHFYHYHHVPRSNYAHKILALLLHSVSGRPMGNIHTFQHLHTIHLRLAGLLLDDVYPVFRLPSVCTLTIEEANACPTSRNNNIQKRFSSVKNLSIIDSFIASSSLSELAMSCRALKKLRCTYSSNTFHGHVHPVNYATIYSALEEHKETLEYIDLDDESNREVTLLTEYERHRFGSFRDFPNLKVLGAPFEAFPPPEDPSRPAGPPDDDEPEVMLSHLLPPTLQTLILTVFEDEEHSLGCSESLSTLYDNFLSVVPNLAHIHVRIHRSVFMKCVDFSFPRYRFQSSDVIFDVTQDGIDEEDLIFTEDEMGWDSELEEYWDPYEYWDEEMDSFDEEEELMGAINGDPQLLHQMVAHLFPDVAPGEGQDPGPAA